MKRILTAVFLLMLVTPAWGQDFEKGLQAYERRDYATAYREWKPLAEQGDSDAQYNLGSLYYHAEQDYANATKWWRKAAQQGVSQAQHDLGSLYTLGLGVPQSDAEAAKWFRFAAEQGHPLGQYNLGASYYSGEGVPQDYVQAAILFWKAATAGIVMAQNNLGAMYWQGLGVRQNYQEAAKWFRLAAEQSAESALRKTGAFQAGVLGRKFPILTGKSSPVMETYLQVIAYAIAAAKNALGGLHAEGLGVPRDDVEAFMWFQLAADQGNSDAADNRDWIAERMTPDQIAEAQRLARKWWDMHEQK